MSNGYFHKYTTLGKPANKAYIFALPRNKTKCDKLYPQAALVQFNSTYIELFDRWNYDRGWPLWIMGIGVFVTAFFAWGTVAFFKLTTESWLWVFASLTLLVFGTFFAWVSYLIAHRELFGYTYYPIRFNRKLRKIYVIQPNRKLVVADWDKVEIGLCRVVNKYDIRFSIIEDGKVKEAFALPYTDGYAQDSLLGHWEFVRRYMEDADVKAVYEATPRHYPIHLRKETVSESVTKMMMYGTHPTFDDPITRLSRFGFYIAFPITVLLIILRRISIFFSRTPKFPDWVEAECKIEADDPYNMDKHPKGALKEIEETPLMQWVLGIFYGACIAFSCIAGLVILDKTAEAKGHDLIEWL